MTKARDLSIIARSISAGKIPSAKLDVSFTNITDTGTSGLTLPKGTEAQRGSTEGMIRYNTEKDVIEYRNASAYKIVGENENPTFTTASGSLGTLNDSNRAASQLTTSTIVGDDPENKTLTFSVKAGSSLPAGLSLASNGAISGTADPVSTNTTTSFIVVLSDGVLSAESSFSITVNAPTFSFTTAAGSIGTITDANRGSYSFSAVTGTGSSGSVAYTIQSGSLPSALSLASNGTISGTLNHVTSQTTSTFTVRATLTTGSVTKTFDRQFTITVEPIVITFATAAGSLGSIYDSTRSSYSLSSAAATASSGTLSYAIQSGSIPGGLSFNTSNAAITGTASAVGSNTTSTFTVRATSSTGVTLDREFTILVYAPQIISYGTTGSSQTFDTSVVKNFQVKAVGAGSQSGNQTAEGGYAQAQVSVASGVNTLYIVVGERSNQSNNTSVWKGGRGNRGGGGASYTGGGFSGIFTGSSPSQGNAILIAAGAGGDGSNNNRAPLNGGNHSTSPDNCCGTNGGGNGSALQGGHGGGGNNSGGGGGGGYNGGGGGGGACCSGNGGKGGSNYTGGDSGSATTSSASSNSNRNSGSHPAGYGGYGSPGNDGRLWIIY